MLREATAITATERFDELFVRLYPALFGLSYRVLGDRTEVEEVLQEAFLRLSRDEVLNRPDEEVAAWLRRVCLNRAFNRVRDDRRAREGAERAGRLESAAPTGEEDPAGAVLRREEQDEVRRVLAGLPERQRHCLLLRHSGYSYAEIAETLGLALGSVGVLLARAERAFRDGYQGARA